MSHSLQEVSMILTPAGSKADNGRDKPYRRCVEANIARHSGRRKPWNLLLPTVSGRPLQAVDQLGQHLVLRGQVVLDLLCFVQYGFGIVVGVECTLVRRSA